jgi:BolA protein
MDRLDRQDLAEHVRRKLVAGLPARSVEIVDESDAHVGHRGSGGGAHLRLTVVSEVFEGKAPLARHRAVHAVLADEMKQRIHALALITLTPDEAARR